MAQKKANPKPKKPDASTDGRVAQIKRLIDVMVAAGAVEVEMEEAGCKLRVRLKEDRPVLAAPAAFAVPAHPPASAPAAREPGHAAPAGAPAAPPAKPVEGETYKSPMVGTFYTASSPDAEAFVKPGDKVKAEQTLCIIEAMKVMNEIKAEKDAVVLEILATNGEPVEFGQPLFLLKA